MKYQNITKDDMLNGDGLRVVLWVSGCSHRCEGCQNKLTWDDNDGLEFDESAKTELFDSLNKDYISGITLSGGDPMYYKNRSAIFNLVKDIKSKYKDKTIWLYTGFIWEHLYLDNKNYEPILDYIDVLVDGKFEKDKFDQKLLWKGSSNQRVINVQKSISTGKVVLHCENYKEV